MTKKTLKKANEKEMASKKVVKKKTAKRADVPKAKKTEAPKGASPKKAALKGVAPKTLKAGAQGLALNVWKVECPIDKVIGQKLSLSQAEALRDEHNRNTGHQAIATRDQ